MKITPEHARYFLRTLAEEDPLFCHHGSVHARGRETDKRLAELINAVIDIKPFLAKE